MIPTQWLRDPLNRDDVYPLPTIPVGPFGHTGPHNHSDHGLHNLTLVIPGVGSFPITGPGHAAHTTHPVHPAHPTATYSFSPDNFVVNHLDPYVGWALNSATGADNTVIGVPAPSPDIRFTILYYCTFLR